MGGDDDNNHVYAWYSDNLVSGGTSDDLARYRDAYAYRLASGYTPADVAEMFIDGSFCCVMYVDGNVSCGTTDDLASARTVYPSMF
jgi:hypothetical protein